MGASEWVTIGLAVFTLLFTVIGWLLSRQIKQHEELDKEKFKDVEASIQLLFKKHDEDAAKLQDLRETVIGQHYRREELDVRFERLENTFKAGFDGVGDKLDELSKVMVSHIGEHTGVYRSGAKP